MALILIMGIPASGKSTIRRRLQTAHPDLIESTSFDEFRVSNSTKIPDTARNSRKSFESHVEREILKIGDSRKIYLIEDIFHLKSMRRPFQKTARKQTMEFGVVHLDVEVSEAIRRNSGRKDEEKQKEETILKIFESLEVSEEEVILGQDEAKDIELEDLLKKLKIELERRKSDEATTENRRKELKRKNPSPPTPASLPLQDFDVQTRRLVSELIQNDRSLDGRKMSIARSKLISVESNVNLNYTELKLKLLDIYDKL